MRINSMKIFFHSFAILSIAYLTVVSSQIVIDRAFLDRLYIYLVVILFAVCFSYYFVIEFTEAVEKPEKEGDA